ncbi:hypothetical protein KC316_g11389 [Hortaea werneckii]|nr:hypothetical protein KC324_g13164 [Hortaea werneckii]KAI7574637.1 hypothetical protein KC316_g11389 [Hortaea werneckii]
METSPFARLSAELRNKIYSYALYNPDGVWLEHPSDDLKLKPGWKLRIHASGNPTALAMTCRQIHAESGLLFYSINKFFIKLSPMKIKDRFETGVWYPWDEEVETWLETIGSANASYVARLCLHLGNYCSNEEADNIWDESYYANLSKLWARAWPDHLSPSLSFGLEFLNLESPSSPDDCWVESLFELPFCDKSEAERQVNLIFDQKLAGLRARLK